MVIIILSFVNIIEEYLMKHYYYYYYVNFIIMMINIIIHNYCFMFIMNIFLESS